MEDLGKVFREFRISKNYSLKEAAGEACRRRTHGEPVAIGPADRRPRRSRARMGRIVGAGVKEKTDGKI